MAVMKEVTFQEIVQMVTGATPQRVSVKADEADKPGVVEEGDKALALSDEDFASTMGMDKDAYTKVFTRRIQHLSTHTNFAQSRLFSFICNPDSLHHCFPFFSVLQVARLEED
jgi:hypothetical protein